MIAAMSVAAAWEEGFDTGYMKAKRRFLEVLARLSTDEVRNAALREIGRSMAEERAEVKREGFG